MPIGSKCIQIRGQTNELNAHNPKVTPNMPIEAKCIQLRSNTETNNQFTNREKKKIQLKKNPLGQKHKYNNQTWNKFLATISWQELTEVKDLHLKM